MCLLANGDGTEQLEGGLDILSSQEGRPWEDRPISLTESMRKLFERVLLKGLCEHLEPLDLFQGGFRAKRSTLEQVAALHEI